MKNFQPRASVEQHYHIRELIERQDKRATERQQVIDRKEAYDERNRDIAGHKAKELVDFHCSDCLTDFKGEAIKQVEIDWSNDQQNIAFYKSKCFCGKWVMRFITDRFRDPYWFKSNNVAKDRGRHHNDILQPFETGYNILYGKK